MNNLSEIIPNIKENEPLSAHANFKIGGPAKYFAEIGELEVLVKALNFATANNLPYFILGGGSNILINDNGFAGLVIKLTNNQIKFLDNNQVEVQANVSLAKLINEALENGLGGLEFAAGIPGSVGGAIYGNAGTYGVGMNSVVEKVIAVTQSGEIKEFSNADCGFAYRHSEFKNNKFIIWSAILQLPKVEVEASRRIIKERIEKRIATQPYNLPSAGCAFKNVLITPGVLAQLAKYSKEVPQAFMTNGKIPAGWLIERIDLKGKTIGGAQVSEKHANYIVNLGSATASDVLMLMSFIKQQVRDKTGIQLEEEVQLMGF